MTAFAAAAIGIRAARNAKRESRSKAIAFPGVRGIAVKLGSSILVLGGLGALTTAAWLWNPLVGLVALGLSLFTAHFELQ